MALRVTGRYRYPPPRPAWLELHAEPILEPDLPIIDAHHHLWVEPGNPYLLDELAADVTSGHRIVATVFVQAYYGYREHGPAELRCVGETEQVAAIRSAARRRALGSDIAAAIVGFADLLLGERVASVLEAHRQAAPDAFRGVRQSVSRDENFPEGIVVPPAPPGLLADSRFRAGLAAVQRHGLTFDAMLYHGQIRELEALAAALPELPVVLDHLGCILGVGPYEGRQHEEFLTWRADMTALARRPNVFVKLGGLGMIVCGARWHEHATPPNSEQLAAAWRPYVETCIELFGPRRCMFEGNFPVDKGMFSYPVLWNAFKRLTVGMSAAERAELFQGTAARFYQIS
jgi:L-fuconolactonase